MQYYTVHHKENRTYMEIWHRGWWFKLRPQRPVCFGFTVAESQQSPNSSQGVRVATSWSCTWCRACRGPRTRGGGKPQARAAPRRGIWRWPAVGGKAQRPDCAPTCCDRGLCHSAVARNPPVEEYENYIFWKTCEMDAGIKSYPRHIVNPIRTKLLFSSFFVT